ncbi:MAG: TIM-barrel domain-containing protein [Oceanococcus sp.]
MTVPPVSLHLGLKATNHILTASKIPIMFKLISTPLALLLTLTVAACNGQADESRTTQTGNTNTTPAAEALLQINESLITLSSPSGQVQISREPFQIRFLDVHGKLVLQQSNNSGGALQPGLILDDPLGSSHIPDVGLHAPLSFMVGLQFSPQYRASPWVGNYITQGLVGLEYHATAVTAAIAIDNGVELTLASNDPIGRTITARIISDIAGSFGVSATVSPAEGVTFVADNFTLQADESFHGFGGRHNAVDQRGNALSNFIQAQNVGAGPAAPIAGPLSGGGENFLFPSGPDAAYYISTAFASTAGYGFMLDQSVPSRYHLGSDDPQAWQVNALGHELSYLVIPGNERRALQGLSSIQGRHRVPAPGDLGPTLSRAVRVLSAEADDAVSYEAKVRADIARIDAEQLPIKGYAFEGWEILERETSREIIDMLHQRGIRAYLYIRNYVGLDPANTERPETFTEAIESGYVTTDILGAPYLFGTPFGGLGASIDFTNPAAVNWWRGRILEMIVDLGSDGFMQDFGEHIALDMYFADGSTGYTMHNHYPTLFHQTTRQIIDEVEAQTGRHIFFWTRAGYSGRGGSSAYESSNFPGDETSDWSRASGIASLTTDMLSRSATGSYGFNTDIGGYFDYHVGPADAELYTRWSFWAALSPIFRVHNSSSNGVRMPWFFGDQTQAHWNKAAQLHLAAAPLILQLWEEAQSRGIPPTRGLWFHYPDDARARAEDQQWMLGPDVLVAPVIEQGAVTRDVYLPLGCWQHVDSSISFEGPADVTVDAPIDSLPYFFRCGTRPF